MMNLSARFYFHLEEANRSFDLYKSLQNNHLRQWPLTACRFCPFVGKKCRPKIPSILSSLSKLTNADNPQLALSTYYRTPVYRTTPFPMRIDSEMRSVM